MPKCSVYILESTNAKRFYIGSAKEPEARVHRHNAGHVQATKNKGPWAMIFSQEFTSVTEARQIEAWLKRMKSRELLEQIVRERKIKKRFR